MNSPDSSDDSNSSSDNFQYWNDWKKPDVNINAKAKVNAQKNSPTKILKITNNLRRKRKIQNWIPPAIILESDKSKLKCLVRNKERCKIDTTENMTDSFNEEKSLHEESISIVSSPCNTTTFEVDKLLKIDWGRRTELHNVMEYLEGNLIWGVVNLGFFDVINLWINRYGNICALAEGAISKVGFSETTKIYIMNTQLLQKMLGLSHPQWASLCERVHQKKENLRFNSSNVVDFEKMTSLERLWYLICKKRHYRPPQCMLLKFNGVIKSLKEFKIIPKFIVQDIKNMHDKESLTLINFNK